MRLRTTRFAGLLSAVYSVAAPHLASCALGAGGAFQADAVLTVAAQLGDWRLWPGVHRWITATYFHLMIPAVAHLFGHAPGWALGGGAMPLPKQVALEWARWCRQPEVFIGDGVPAAGFSRLAVPIQAWSFTDDASFAPKEAVDRLHRLFENASLDRRHVSPRELNVKAIGHFGAFNPRFRDTLWPRFAEGLLQPSTESGISAGASTEQLRVKPSLNF